jgi:hypothetical protein
MNPYPRSDIQAAVAANPNIRTAWGKKRRENADIEPSSDFFGGFRASRNGPSHDAIRKPPPPVWRERVVACLVQGAPDQSLLLTRLHPPLGDLQSMHGRRIGAVQYCTLSSVIHRGFGEFSPLGRNPIAAMHSRLPQRVKSRLPVQRSDVCFRQVRTWSVRRCTLVRPFHSA